MSLLSDRILKETAVYLGPASKMFLERQTIKHMNNLAFESVGKQHLGELSEWVFISAGLVIDKGKARELADKIAKM